MGMAAAQTGTLDGYADMTCQMMYTVEASKPGIWAMSDCHPSNAVGRNVSWISEQQLMEHVSNI